MPSNNDYENLGGWELPDRQELEVFESAQGAFGDTPAAEAAADGDRFLWDACRKINFGDNLPTHDQKIGDCVSQAVGSAVDYLQCIAKIEGRVGRTAIVSTVRTSVCHAARLTTQRR